MRKYFLTTAATLMLTTNVNATTTEFAELEIHATIQEALQGSCTPLDFGIIALPSYAGDSTVTIIDNNNYETTGDVISVTGFKSAYCSYKGYDDEDDYTFAGTAQWPDSVTLEGMESGKKLTVTNFMDNSSSHDGYDFGATLNIPADAVPDSYEGYAIVKHVY